MSQRIHLDYASSTPMLPEVKQAMAAALDEAGNPSSIHQAGQRAKQLLEQARKQVAALINPSTPPARLAPPNEAAGVARDSAPRDVPAGLHVKPEEIYFTSCGTESNNWAIRGLLAANKRKGHSLDSGRRRELEPSLGTPPHGPIRGAPHLIISAIEHPSISLIARRLEVDGLATVTVLPVDPDGLIAPSTLKALLTPQTALVSVMLANGEVGTVEPIRELAAVAHEQGAFVHTDAIAAVGHLPVDVRALGVDALSLAANQFYGPPGAAALYVREGVRILPLLEGGGQEFGGRSGTEALPAIVGMGVAAELRAEVVAKRQDPSQDFVARLSDLRDRLRDGLKERIEHVRFNGSWSARLPHNLHVCIDGVSSESLVLGLDQAGIAAGLGSACNSKAMRPSHVLKAMGLTDEQAKGALVLSVGVPTTEEEIDRALELIPQVVERLRRVTTLTSRA